MRHIAYIKISEKKTVHTKAIFSFSNFKAIFLQTAWVIYWQVFDLSVWFIYLWSCSFYVSRSFLFPFFAHLESILSKLKRFEYLFSGFFSVFLDANEYEIKLWNWFALFSLNKCIVLLNSYIFLNNLDMIVFSEKENILVINETNLFWQVYSSLVF